MAGWEVTERGRAISDEMVVAGTTVFNNTTRWELQAMSNDALIHLELEPADAETLVVVLSTAITRLQERKLPPDHPTLLRLRSMHLQVLIKTRRAQ